MYRLHKLFYLPEKEALERYFDAAVFLEPEVSCRHSAAAFSSSKVVEIIFITKLHGRLRRNDFNAVPNK